MSHTQLARSPHYSNRHRVSSILTRGQTSILSRTKNRLIHSHPVNTRPNTRGRVTVLEIEATISGQEMSASFGVKSGTWTHVTVCTFKCKQPYEKMCTVHHSEHARKELQQWRRHSKNKELGCRHSMTNFCFPIGIFLSFPLGVRDSDDSV